MPNRFLRRALRAGLVVMCVASWARAWDAPGHRMITRVAMERLAREPGVPAWLVGEATPAAAPGDGASNPAGARAGGMGDWVADQATTPDRWRAIRVPALKHLNDPDHYIDVEDLWDYGLTLDGLPRLRYEFVKALVLGRAKEGFKGEPVNPAADPARVQEYPGFLPHASIETYGKIVSALKTARIVEGLKDPSRSHQVEMARASAAYNMGILSHYIGDAAQPLHTTRHHHGWKGENPKGYTTDRGIHRYIDGTIVAHHAITDADVRAIALAPEGPRGTVDPADPWPAILAHVQRSFDQVVPLYELKKSGELEGAPGRAFIASRLADGSSMLGELYAAAWRASAPTPADVEEFLKYDVFDARRDAPARAGQAAAPAPAPGVP